MNKTSVVGGMLLVALAVGVSVFILQRSSAAPGQNEPAVPGTEGVIGTPEALPLATTELTSEERQLAERLGFGIPEVADNLRGKRYQVVGEELARDKAGPCENPTARACATVHIFNYTDGQCIQVILDLENRTPLFVKLDGWCSVSLAELDQARQIAESQPQVQKILEANEGKFVHSHAVIPRSSLPGHRYIGVGYTLDSGTASIEFVVNLTTQSVCYEC